MTGAATLFEQSAPADGPIVSAVRGWLDQAGIEDGDLDIAERSPFGHRALRLRLQHSAGECRATATSERLAAAYRWAAIRAIPPSVYLVPDIDQMREWSARPRPVPDRDTRHATLSYPDPEALSSAPLDSLRQVAVARALAALLGDAGWEVTHRVVPVGASHAFVRSQPVSLHLATATLSGCDLAIDIAGVDLPKGPLRARYGGSVQVGDLIRELDNGHNATDRASALASYIMLRCKRTQRIDLDQAKLVADQTTFAELIAAAEARGSSAPPLPIAQSDLVNVILALDATGAVAQRALVALDPYEFIRHLRGLAHDAVRMDAADPVSAMIGALLRRAITQLALNPQPHRTAPSAATLH